MIGIIILGVAFAAFVYVRLIFASKFFQQDDYSDKRFFYFIFKRFQLIDKRVFPVLLLIAIFLGGWKFASYLAALALLIGTAIEKNPIKAAKKKLVKTTRWKRIFFLAYALPLGAFITWPGVWSAAILTVLLPLFLILANMILHPVEEYIIRARYVAAAKKKLAKINPISIGITGSFGKTSVKNILQHILSSVSNSYATPRSINTIMGVVRLINEDLKPEHKYFIVEMGTDHPNGSLGKLCALINPEYGILTAIGTAHLDNFKNQDELAREKAKLLQCVSARSGKLIVNGATVDKKYMRMYAPANATIINSNVIENLKIDADGLHFDLNYDGKHHVFAPVYGSHQAVNIALAFAAARMLGVPTSTILAALTSLPQTPHRLEVIKSGKITIIDDGFNSNIDGFKSAIETARMLADESKGRAIIITPGIVELGPLHASYHNQIGEYSNKIMDVVIAVAPHRIIDYTNQISKDKLVLVDSKKDADAWLMKNAKPGDVVLYENDLPDLFEEKIRI